MTASAANYPGSKTERRSVSAAREQVAASEGWDAHPMLYDVNGRAVEFYSIAALAHALQRRPQVLRDWEAMGWDPPRFLEDGRRLTYLPPPTMRTHGTRQRNRLYTRAQVEGLIAIAQEEGLFKPGARVGTTNFPLRARELFDELKESG